MKAVVLLSGGLDSTTLAYKMQDDGYELHTLAFNYGQRHSKELRVAEDIAKGLSAQHHTIILHASGYRDGILAGTMLGDLITSALTTDAIAVPHGHYEEDSMKATIVPNRNAIMLSIAYGIAVSDGAHLVAFAAHSGDHAIYPDCRPEFVKALSSALMEGNSWANPLPVVVAPFINKSKAEIAIAAHMLHVPIARTWSCYEGGDIHCGVCGTCYERREALSEALGETGYPDPTAYADNSTLFVRPGR